MKNTGTNHAAYAQALTRVNFFSKKEIAELPKLLLADEKILAVISGFYAAGTAILCVTSRRILLIDKKIIRLLIEDLRFEFITEVSYGYQAVMASISFFAGGKEMQFKSWYRNELRMLSQLVQQKMYEVQQKTSTSDELGMVQPHQLPQSYGSSPQTEQYLNDRIARWRKATRFVDMLVVSNKTGKRVLDIESPKS